MKVGIGGLLVWRIGAPGDGSRGAEAEGRKFVLDVPGVDNTYDAVDQIEQALAAAFPLEGR